MFYLVARSFGKKDGRGLKNNFWSFLRFSIMRVASVLIIFVVAVFDCWGQKHFVAYSVYGSQNRVIRPGFDYYLPLLTVQGGGLYQFETQKWSMGAQLNYTTFGFKQQLMFMDKNEQLLGNNLEYHSHRFVSFAPFIGYRLGEKWCASPKIGVSFNRFVVEKVWMHEVELNDTLKLSAYQHYFSDYKHWNISFQTQMELGRYLPNFRFIGVVVQLQYSIIRMNYEVPSVYPWKYFQTGIGFVYRTPIALDGGTD